MGDDCGANPETLLIEVGTPGIEPWNWASPKLKTSPAESAIQYPWPSGVGAEKTS